ncbi:L-tartrate dehydratase subunit alpha [Escherichia coli]|uniref:L-tartrate dehydratase subunit alpha n=1 Tax=Escherichia coli TaxID=562 RepID=A0A484YX54_ECOLX|nr:L-tartrate dehydratase subunit alpha [Escherichia coli]
MEEATVKAPLRHNAVEIFDEVNTGKNTGSGVPWVTWDIVPDGDDAEIEVTWQAAAARYLADRKC